MIEMLWKLFFSFFQIGLFTIGGGYAMIPLIERELVAVHGWMTAPELADLIGISQMTPGPFAMNAATFAGMKLLSASYGWGWGIVGTLVATAGVMIPSVIIVLLLARRFFNLQNNPIFQAVMSGVRPVVLALILTAMVTIAEKTLLTGVLSWDISAAAALIDWKAVVICAGSLVALLRFKINPILVLACAGVLGGVLYG